MNRYSDSKVVPILLFYSEYVSRSVEQLGRSLLAYSWLGLYNHNSDLAHPKLILLFSTHPAQPLLASTQLDPPTYQNDLSSPLVRHTSI